MALKNFMATSAVAMTLISTCRFSEAKPIVEDRLKQDTGSFEIIVSSRSFNFELTPFENALKKPEAVYRSNIAVGENHIRSNPNDKRGYLDAGVSYYKIFLYYSGSQFDKDSAISMLNQAEDIDKKDAYPNVVKSDIYYRSKNYKKEFEELEKAKVKEPGNSEIDIYLDAVRKKLSETDAER